MNLYYKYLVLDIEVILYCESFWFGFIIVVLDKSWFDLVSEFFY